MEWWIKKIFLAIIGGIFSIILRITSIIERFSVISASGVDKFLGFPYAYVISRNMCAPYI
jgi:hypothetical protein